MIIAVGSLIVTVQAKVRPFLSRRSTAGYLTVLQLLGGRVYAQTYLSFTGSELASQIVLPRALCPGVLCRAAQHRRARLNVCASDICARACGTGRMGVVCLGYVAQRRCSSTSSSLRLTRILVFSVCELPRRYEDRAATYTARCLPSFVSNLV